MKTLACRDAGIDCDFVAHGETEEELFSVGGEHLKNAHNKDMSKASPEEMARYRKLIKEE